MGKHWNVTKGKGAGKSYVNVYIAGNRFRYWNGKAIGLKLSQELYPYIKTKPIHHSQKNYDDEFKVVIKVIRNKELEMLLNSFGIGLDS